MGVAAPAGGGGEACAESGGSGVGRRRPGGRGLRAPRAGLRVLACDGSGAEAAAAAAALAQPARLDPGGPPTSQPREGEEGGCHRRGGRAGVREGPGRPPWGVLLGKAWREAERGAWKSEGREGRGRAGKGQASRGVPEAGPRGGRTSWASASPPLPGPPVASRCVGEAGHRRPRPAVCRGAEFAAPAAGSRLFMGWREGCAAPSPASPPPERRPAPAARGWTAAGWGPRGAAGGLRQSCPRGRGDRAGWGAVKKPL